MFVHRRHGVGLGLLSLLGMMGGCGPTHDTGPGVSACGAEGVLLCDDFETAAVGGAPDSASWQVQVFNQEGRVLIDNTQAHSGSKSVYIDGTGSDSYRSVLITTSVPFPARSNSFYARVFLRSKNAMGEGHSTYFGAGSADNQRMVRVGFQEYVLETNLIVPGTEYGLLSGPWDQPDQGVQLPAGQWHCVEAFFNGAQNELRVWFDDTEVTALHTKNWNAGLSGWSPQYARAWFGFETYHGEQDELWLDDIVVGTQRIGCGS